ncbi:hypothetical protein [Dulcicalothrix desertica]|nr:hypothetical protein [Dulcicalothrix desertica]
MLYYSIERQDLPFGENTAEHVFLSLVKPLIEGTQNQRRRELCQIVKTGQ